MRSMTEGLLQSKGTTPQALPGCFSVSLAKSSVFSRRRKTPRDALRLVQLTPYTGEPNERDHEESRQIREKCRISVDSTGRMW